MKKNTVPMVNVSITKLPSTEETAQCTDTRWAVSLELKRTSINF